MQLTEARDININGQIVGWAQRNRTNMLYLAYMLTPGEAATDDGSGDLQTIATPHCAALSDADDDSAILRDEDDSSRRADAIRNCALAVRMACAVDAVLLRVVCDKGGWRALVAGPRSDALSASSTSIICSRMFAILTHLPRPMGVIDHQVVKSLQLVELHDDRGSLRMR